MPPGQLEAVVGAEQVGLDHIVGTAVDTGQGRGLGRTFDERVDRGDGQEIVELADVGVLELDPGRPQAGQVQLRATTAQVVDGEQLPVGVTAGQAQGRVGSDEAGTAGHEDAHGAIFSNVPAMRAVPTDLEGAILLEPSVHGDERGFFLETFRRSTLDELGLGMEFVQDNQSRSRRGIVRGMHFQPGMAKLVRCARGAIFDVVVDVRRGSPGFGRWVGFELNDVNHHQLFCPDGFAHGFCVLSELADVAYKTSNYYAPELEGGFAYNDPDVDIAWPEALELIASPRDTQAPRLAELEAALPFEYATMQL